MKRKSVKITSVLFIFLLAFSQIALAARKPPTTTTTTTVKPIFGSSFVQYWYAQDFTVDRWTAEFKMLLNAGINEIILQDVADTKEKYAAYFSSISGYTNNDVDMLENALTAADPLGMKVRIGLGFNGDWWTKNASDNTWLTTEANNEKAIVDEIEAKYGTHSSFTGWYIPYEFSQLSARTSTQQSYLNNFFKQITSEIRNKDTNSSHDIMVAPFYNSKYSFLSSLSSWPTMLQNILKGTGINIVALQDSIGAGYNTMSQLPNIYSYTKKAVSSVGMKLYADTETFTSTSTGNVPAAQTRISSQLSTEKTYVQGFVAFSIDHYQNSNAPDQLTYYNDYYSYYLGYK